jgi:hypothetical protein
MGEIVWFYGNVLQRHSGCEEHLEVKQEVGRSVQLTPFYKIGMSREVSPLRLEGAGKNVLPSSPRNATRRCVFAFS